jgi:hypothetical protein
MEHSIIRRIMTKKYIKKHKFIIPLIFIGCSLTSCIVVPIECVNNDISLTKDLSQTSDSDVDFANLPLYYSDVTPNKFNTNKKIINDPSH